MIPLSVNEQILEKTAAWMQKRGVRLPTFAEMRNPDTLPADIQTRLPAVDLWAVDPLNLFRITWKNQPVETGGGFGPVNAWEIPPALTGVSARITGLVGKWFPTGSHKVGATYGCLVPALVTGGFAPAETRAAWPSTGNFCRGGAFNAALMGCHSIAVLPEEMSRERFQWLREIAGEVITTPGGESNVKEIYDQCKALRSGRDDIAVFNQFDDFGNYLWHFAVTGPAVEEAFHGRYDESVRPAGFAAASGSAGTLAAGDYLKTRFPGIWIAAAEALQCPTLLYNGYGAHRIEGIGDKHIPWIHNVRNTDIITAVDDNDPVGLVRLFNEPAGKDYLAGIGVPDEDLGRLSLLGISSVANLLAAVKLAKYFELTRRDVIFTVFTDSMDLYQSRLAEWRETMGEYTRSMAAVDYNRRLLGQGVDHVKELTLPQKKRIHNLKYFTWVEQQGKPAESLTAQWRDFPDYWTAVQNQLPEIDARIESFNRKTGLRP